MANSWGVATLNFDPPIRNAPQHGYAPISSPAFNGETIHNPVIFHKPEMKGRLLAGSVQYIDKPLKAMDIVFDVIEDMTE
jgi:hypothetical protein